MSTKSIWYIKSQLKNYGNIKSSTLQQKFFFQVWIPNWELYNEKKTRKPWVLKKKKKEFKIRTLMMVQFEVCSFC